MVLGHYSTYFLGLNRIQGSGLQIFDQSDPFPKARVSEHVLKTRSCAEQTLAILAEDLPETQKVGKIIARNLDIAPTTIIQHAFGVQIACSVYGLRLWIYWVAVKELKLSYYIGGTLLFTIYTHHGNLI